MLTYSLDEEISNIHVKSSGQISNLIRSELLYDCVDIHTCIYVAKMPSF